MKKVIGKSTCLMYKKINSYMVGYLLIIIILTADAMFIGINCGLPNKYTYYFYLPTRGTLTLVGINASTVSVYKLTGVEYILKSKVNVDRLEKVTITLERGFYKLVSTERVVAVAWIDEDITTLYTSTEGGYVGREFIIPGFTGVGAVHAFEDSEITIYDRRGKKLQEFRLWQNETKMIALTADIFRIVSTGRIAVGQHNDQGIMFMVDATGKFRGKNLFGGHHSTMGVLVISPYQTCKVRVHFAIAAGKVVEHVFTEKDVENNIFWEYPNTAEAFYWIVSTGDVTVLVGEGEYNNTAAMLRGVAMAVIPAKMTFRVFAPTAMIVIPFKSGVIRINDETQEVLKGQPIICPMRGSYEIVANIPVTIEIIGTSESSLAESKVWRDGECLLSDKDIVDYGFPKPSAKPKRGLSMTIIITIVIFMILLTMLIIFLLRRKECYQRK